MPYHWQEAMLILYDWRKLDHLVIRAVGKMLWKDWLAVEWARITRGPQKARIEMDRKKERARLWVTPHPNCKKGK